MVREAHDLYKSQAASVMRRAPPPPYCMQLGVGHGMKAGYPDVTLRSFGHQAQPEGQSALPPLSAVRIYLTVPSG